VSKQSDAPHSHKSVGLALNATLHWWSADPLASLIIVYYGIREGREAWRHP
jgi:hypothetical protein